MNNNIEKFVVRDKTSGLYVQCWTENSTIFFTDNLDQIETHETVEGARSMMIRIQTYAEEFLNDKDDKEIKNVSLEFGVLKITTSFEALSG
jgi:hypothetical protein